MNPEIKKVNELMKKAIDLEEPNKKSKRKISVQKEESVIYEVIDEETNELLDRFEALSYPLHLSKKEAKSKAFNLKRKIEQGAKIFEKDVNNNNSELITKKVKQ